MEIPIDKIKSFPLVTTICAIGAILPGYLLVFVYEEELFFKLSPFNLSVVSLGITTLFFAFNIAISYTISGLLYSRTRVKVSELHFYTSSVFYATIMSCFSMIIAFMSSFVFGRDIKIAFRGIAISEISMFILFSLSVRLSEKRVKDHSARPDND
ncbi:MAG: hypothetical protein BGO70_10770 [Bacteroidetes bacterium 43-93]|nr:hypothetical protein [Bacteroidota bacterium]OJW95598.1 MAG: hypothetical protein BGO70_10770 [Bacteroidetes bacterium 43-93]